MSSNLVARFPWAERHRAFEAVREFAQGATLRTVGNLSRIEDGPGWLITADGAGYEEVHEVSEDEADRLEVAINAASENRPPMREVVRDGRARRVSVDRLARAAEATFFEAIRSGATVAQAEALAYGAGQ